LKWPARFAKKSTGFSRLFPDPQIFICAGGKITYKNPMCKSCERCAPYLLSVLRVVIALLILCHGGQKIFDYPSSNHGTLPPFSWPGGISGLLELVGGAFVLLGLFTRCAAFILSGEMAVAYFMVHAHEAFWPIHNKGELAVIYCFVFLYLSAAGAGPLSVDHFLRKGASAPPPSIV